MQTPITAKAPLSSTALKPIILKARQLLEVEQQLKQLAENGLGEHIQVADLNQGCLTILADSAAWGMQFRFQQASLLTQLQLHLRQTTVRAFKVKIRPLDPITHFHYWRNPVLSVNSAAIIASTATYITDEKLKKSLLRLAAHAHKKGEAS